MGRAMTWTGLSFVGLLLAACGSGAPDSATDSAPDTATSQPGPATAAPSPVDTDSPSPTGAPAGQPDDATIAAGQCQLGSELAGGDVEVAPATDAPFPWDRDDPVVRDGFNFDEVISGGPPPDGILPIEEPCFDTVERADTWLAGTSPVMVLEVGDDVRAYPLAIMTQHEIANDVVGGVPVVVTYCPLCNSGLAFERTIDDVVSDFGTSGRLYQANLVMYDRQTRTLWTQFTGEAVVGDQVPRTLERVPTTLLGWSDFRDLYPDGLVLSPDTFPTRDYGRNPYVGYEDNGDQFLFRGPRDDRLAPNMRVVGLGGDPDAVAVPLERLTDESVVAAEVGGQPVVVFWAPGQASALDAGTVDEGRDVGSTAAFTPVLDDDTMLTFTPSPQADDRWIDDQTGSTWGLDGRAVAGDLAGTMLEPVEHDDTFWFVWYAFRSNTVVAQ